MDPFVLATFIVAFLAMLIGIVAILFTFMERNTNSERARRHGHKVKYVLDGEKYSPSQLKHGFETDSGVIYSGNVVALVDKDKHLDLYHVTRDGGESIDATHSQYQLPNNPYTQNNLIVVKSSKQVAQRTDDTIGSALHAIYSQLLSKIQSQATFQDVVSDIFPNPNAHKHCSFSMFSVKLNEKQPFDAMKATAYIRYRAHYAMHEGQYDDNITDSEHTSTTPSFDENSLFEIPVTGYSVDTDGTIRSDKSNLQIREPVNGYGNGGCNIDSYVTAVGLTTAALGYPSLEICNKNGLCYLNIYMDFDGVRRAAKYSELTARLYPLVSETSNMILNCAIRIDSLFMPKGAI